MAQPVVLGPNTPVVSIATVYSCAKRRSELSILIRLSKGRRVVRMESKCIRGGGHEEGVLENMEEIHI